MLRRVVLAALAVTLGVPVAAARAATSVCDRFGPGSVSGHVKNPQLREISGLAASRRHPGVYWTHNDSGGKPEVFALKLDGTDLGAYPLAGAAARDWEDIAVGPKRGASGSFIYAADIGDNNAVRDHVTVYRVAEPGALPVAPGHALGNVEKIDLVYPDGAEDAESLLVDPVTGELVIITKSVFGRSRLLVASGSSLVHGARVKMKDRGIIQIVPTFNPTSRFPGTFVTGADITADGSLILVRTYQAVLAFARGKGQSVADALHGSSCNASHTAETQGEAIALAADLSSYATTSEGSGQPINVFRINGVTAATPTTPTSPTTAAARAGERVLPRPALTLVLPLLLTAMLGGALMVRRRLKLGRDGEI